MAVHTYALGKVQYDVDEWAHISGRRATLTVMHQYSGMQLKGAGVNLALRDMITSMVR